ncbi:MAG: undecaprenyl-diphosphate phosphatase [Actinomycetota bacterium]
MQIWQAIVLGVIEGLTEFLPVSSTGHLTIAERALGLRVDDPAVTGFTAVIQIGAIAAVVLALRADVSRVAAAWLRSLRDPSRRGPDARLGWIVIVGTVPIGIAAVAFHDIITGPIRSLWWVGAALVAWSAVMVAAELVARQDRSERALTTRDGIVVGIFQAVALVPGVSRSAATISGGLFRGLDRVTATRFAFLLAIPAMSAAAVVELGDALSAGVGWLPTLTGTVVSFLVAYATVGWLLRFVARHSIVVFAIYRVTLGTTLLLLLATGAVAPR